jgi:hypothetical protein
MSDRPTLQWYKQQIEIPYALIHFIYFISYLSVHDRVL